MNAAWVIAFTVIVIDDWALLFEGERLATQGHTIRLHDLVEQSAGRPFILRLVDADGSKLDAALTDAGRCETDMMLSHALSLAARKP